MACSHNLILPGLSQRYSAYQVSMNDAKQLNNGPHPSVTVVCCIESGVLEENTLRLVESLRRFGGTFKSIPVVAVTPRFGPPLKRRTLALLDRLEVRHVRISPHNSYAWNGYLNKPFALAYAEEHETTEAICWLDSDIIILNQPDLLTVQQSEDFLACVSDFKNNGTSEGDEHELYWRRVSQLVGADFESLPWVITPTDGHRIRAYFNSGVFLYRRRTGFGARFLRSCLDILGARISCKSSGIFFTDQVALGLTAFSMKLRIRMLPFSYNYPIAGVIPRRFISVEDIKVAKILHVHDAMYSPLWPTTMAYLRKAQPDVASWLEEKGPINVQGSVLWRGMSKMLRAWRSSRQQRFSNSCSAL